ncbi:MAG: YkgJ family cysteine cluster protein [bacterium]|nr:YkgJ family cysteine cluster protein [bacterium]
MAQEWQNLLHFRCTCCGNCCREPIVLVTDEDIRRVIHRTGQKAAEVVDFYKPSEIAWGKDQPGWIQLKVGLRIMGLRRTEEGCQYLGEDDLCTIYEHRPVTCRRYPFDVEFGEKGEIQLLSISNSVECPYELDGYQTLGEIKALCTWEEEEENPYYEKIEAWNAQKKSGTKKKFLKCLGF